MVSSYTLAFLIERYLAFRVRLLTLHCSMTHALLFLVCYVRQKDRLIKVCSSVLCKRVKVNFFCF